MRHDEDIGCRKHNGNYKKHMRNVAHGPYDGWSSCSRREYLERYNSLEPFKKWCLQPGDHKSRFKTKVITVQLSIYSYFDRLTVANLEARPLKIFC